MGVHDYICAIHKNDQTLTGFIKLSEPEELNSDNETDYDIGESPTSAYLFSIPSGKKRIKVKRLKKYTYVMDDYNCIDWSFQEYPEYSDVLFSDSDKKYIVSDLLIISPFAYECFVKRTVPSILIPFAYLCEIVENNNIDIPECKKYDKKYIAKQIRNMYIDVYEENQN